MDVRLVLVKKGGQIKAFTLPSTVTTIGRRHSCDMRIPLIVVSKKHCQIYNDNGNYKIRDLSSRNGTLINGKKVDETSVHAGDTLEIGTLKFVMQVDNVPNEEAIRTQLEGIEIAKKTRKVKEPAAASAQKSDDIEEDLDNFFSSQPE